jgi:hypothetical protein
MIELVELLEKLLIASQQLASKDGACWVQPRSVCWKVST